MADTLKRISEAVNDLIRTESMIGAKEEELKMLKELRHKTRTAIIPDLMNEAGIESISVDGHKVSLKSYVSGSLPKDPEKRQRAIEWITEHDGAGLIKSCVISSFGREQRDEAIELHSEITKRGLVVDFDERIHPQTYQAWIRKKLEDGEQVDIDMLGVQVGQVAKIK